MNLYIISVVLVITILNQIFKFIWLCILNFSLNHIQQRFLRYQIFFPLAYWAGIGVHTSINIICIYNKAVNQTVFLMQSFNES